MSDLDGLELAPDPESIPEQGRYGVAEYWTQDMLWSKRRSLELTEGW